MAINLDKHRESLVAAWRDVLDEKTDTNWALFGYDGPSNDLKFISKGDGGLTELIDDLNSGKIMYAFLKVDLPDNSISKYVLINWQGEGAPTVRKGTCANHLQHVARLFPGFALSVHARAEDDLDLRTLSERLSRGGGGARVSPAAAAGRPAPRAPVGTAYTKVDPVAEIDAGARDRFWRREELEESGRVAAERSRRDLEKRKVAEAARRDAPARPEPDAAPQPPGVPRSAEARALIGRAAAAARAVFETGARQHDTRPSAVVPEKPVRSSVIAQRINTFQSNASNDTRAVEKATLSQGDKEQQAKTSPLKNIDKIKMSLESPSQIQHEPILDPGDLSPNGDAERSFSAVTYDANAGFRDIQAEEPRQTEALIKQNILCDDEWSGAPRDDDDDDSDDKFSTIKRSPHAGAQGAHGAHVAQGAQGAQRAPVRQATVVENVNYRNGAGDCAAVSPAAVAPEAVSPVAVSPEEDGAVYEDLADPGLAARALYDYQAADESEITFDPGDVITHIEQVDAGWWQGLGPRGAFGLFPANYVELLPSPR